MKDRFKFRVWYEPKGITSDKPIMIYNAEDTYDCMAGKPVIIYKSCFGDVLEDDEYTVMQCTGLKDKNGKLIYEGDIVKNNQNSLYSVEFAEFEHQTKFCLKRVENPNYYPHISTWQGIGYEDQKTIEVIGNIYQNPELLEND